MPKKDFISLKFLDPQEIEEIFALTARLKKDKDSFSRALDKKSIALIFQKPSCRTRVSFQVGIEQLGGFSVYLGPQEVNLGVRETAADVAMTLSRYVDGIVARTFAHEHILDLAKYASIPVINGLSDLLHPCQAMADLFSLQERLGKLKGLNLAYVGDGNNVCNSLIYGASLTGLNLRVAAPKGYEPDKQVLKESQAFAKQSGSIIGLFGGPQEAVKDADVIYTDVWASMGQEKDAAKRKKAFKGFQVNSKLVSLAKKNCLIMHCLPAHRGQEITDEVIDSKNSIVFDQAENRLHVQKAILIKLFE